MLGATLTKVKSLIESSPIRTELIVVDSASTDDTVAIAEGMLLGADYAKVVPATKKGLSVARNVGLAASSGAVLLFTDDDVIPRDGWIEKMCQPILEGGAEAAAGGVKIAQDLLRPWMTQTHKNWLCSTEWMDQSNPEEMVGANMAFHRRVLKQISGFDEEIGAGTPRYYGEDALLSKQIVALGGRIAPVFDAVVVHHFDPQRLTYESFVGQAELRGRTEAFFAYHWEHVSAARLIAKATVGLLFRAKLNAFKTKFSSPVSGEGIPEWEMNVRRLRTYRAEVKSFAGKPRIYKKHGLKLEPSDRR
jgi:glycosyltransferase involved in cell wall biosynthesis